ncbi:MAG TPA: hypothetical protein VN737_06045 [Bryobacteraceae bacterium]|nr:hypothetical protein [Bryobacteraceae bacterium]
MSDPLSRDEHAAIMRYLAAIRRQLREVSELFSTRYGVQSTVAEIAGKALVCTTLLEHEMLLLEQAAAEPEEVRPEETPREMIAQSAIVGTANRAE